MVNVADIGPVRSRTTFAFDRHHQSVSGKALCVAMSPDGMRMYLGGHSGVWRSDDGGATWTHPERPQPPVGSTTSPGSLLASSVYDLAVSRTNPDVVLAATGNDPRIPTPNGIWRSADGARTWDRVHQFVRGSSIGTVGSVNVAPDDPQLMYAAGGFAIGVSTDGGLTWTERQPSSNLGDRVWYVVCSGLLGGGARAVYAVGNRVWRSNDGGATWITDPAALGAGMPSDSLGSSSGCICIDPTNAFSLYFARNAGELWRGQAPTMGNGPMTWTQMPAVKGDYAGTTASGTDYVIVHQAPDRGKQIIYSDRRSVHVAIGDPSSTADWKRIDSSPVHVDPHGAAVAANFSLAGSGAASGRIVMINDGGAVCSTDGAASWDFGSGLATLGLVNVAVLPRTGVAPSIVIQMGDNNGFFSADGGVTWETQDYRGGDNDCSFADPLQPHRLVVFAPRHGGRSVFLYTTDEGSAADGSWGTGQRHVVPPPPPPPGADKGKWNTVSSHYNLGYRPLVLTPAGEAPLPGGDFITIITADDDSSSQLVRSTRLHDVTASSHWITSVTSDGPGVKVFRQGPSLPRPIMGVVQASGGHASPTFFVGDLEEGQSQSLWSWRAGETAWRQLVPATGVGPTRARRFFVDPYRPSLLYALGTDRIWRSDSGGVTWEADAALQEALTESGAYAVGLTSEAGSSQVILRDMLFDPEEPNWRLAIGVAGVFLTLDGRTWQHLLLSSAAGMRPNNAVYDKISQPCARMIYVATSNRGVLRLGPLPPDWSAVPGGVSAAVGNLTLLRVHDVGTKFGAPGDQLDAEVIIRLDTEPGHSFGFQLRSDADGESNEGMLELLQDAFDHNRRVRIEFTRTSCTMGVVFRVIQQ